MTEAFQLGVDVGGTFTDLALWDGDRLHTGKIPTSADQSEAVVEGIRRMHPGRVAALLHGTTVATNALLERRGARTALITDGGREDVLEIGRQDRPSLYDTTIDRPAPLVPATGRFAPGHPDDLAAALREYGAEAVAIALLYAYADPSTERELAAMVAAALPGIPVSRSAIVAPEFREFERTSTTVLNAYLGPITGRYLEQLSQRAYAAGIADRVQVMRSSGGLIDGVTAAALPAAILLSGPAGGAVAAAELGTALGYDHVISFDMGGTSTDVCRIDGGRPELLYERPVEGYPCRLPSVAIHTVGAGGGSIGWVDAGGALRAGPRSAGANPGPAAYDRGGIEAAVTDANVVLGRIDPAGSPDSGLHIDAGAARSALNRLGAPLGLDPVATAHGIVEIIEARMARAVRTVSVEKGHDPRNAILVAFGGAGGLHATALARRLGMAGVVVPPHCGVFSAVGLLLSPPRADAARSIPPTAAVTSIEPALAAVRSAVAADLERMTGSAGATASSVDVRYAGQSHEITVSYDPGDGEAALRRRFEDTHRTRNGFTLPDAAIEAVTVRAAATGTPALDWDQTAPIPKPGDPRRGTRRAVVAGREEEVAIWWRPCLPPGTEVCGPAVIAEPAATTWIDPGERAVAGSGGELEVTW
jgi:N-methylhydantoinase A